MPLSREPEVRVRSRRELERAGMARRAIDAALERGALKRLRGGFYAWPDAPAGVVAALERGHRITCVGALALYGFWVPWSREPHEAARRCTSAPTPEDDSSTPDAPKVVLHGPALRAWPDDHPVLPLPVALEHAMHCLDADGAAVVLESGLHQGLIGEDEARGACRSLSARRRRAIFPLSRTAESGTETIVRRALQRRGVTVRPQVWIPGVGRVDLLVGERLIIECDSITHHATPEQYRADRRRDLEARRRGYIVLRLTYADVTTTWDKVFADLMIMVRRGDHRVPRSRRSTLLDQRGLLKNPPDPPGPRPRVAAKRT